MRKHWKFNRHDNCMRKDFMNNFEEGRRGRLRHIGPKLTGGMI